MCENLFDLSGKIALVTGTSRGLGQYMGRALARAGADLVIGHGPHVVRAMERYRDRLIAYSLGNFATYYGISVSGIKGVAPIVVAMLDGTGEFGARAAAFLARSRAETARAAAMIWATDA